MPRLRHVVSGVVVSVDDDNPATRDSVWEPVDGGASAPASSYSGMKVDELKAEIANRNEGRDEADLLSDEGKKADLIAALEADDK